MSYLDTHIKPRTRVLMKHFLAAEVLVTFTRYWTVCVYNTSVILAFWYFTWDLSHWQWQCRKEGANILKFYYQ